MMFGEQTTRVGRPVYKDKDGNSFSEKTVTFPIGDRWYTFPSVGKNGNIMSEDDVRSHVIKNGPVDPITGEVFPTFDSVEKAEEYARQRSASLLPDSWNSGMFGNFGSNPFAMPQGALPPQNLYQQPMPRNPMPVPSEMMQPPAPQPSPFGGSGMSNFAPILAGIGAALTTGNASSYIPAFSNMYNRQQDRRALQGEEARKRAEKNKTYQYLQRTDPEAAEMFASGAMSAKDALDWSEKRKKGQEEPKHRTIKGADGFNYWLDGPNQGNRVLPDAQMKEKSGISFTTPDGSTVQIGGSSPKFTELQSKQVTFAQRMKGATDTIDKLEDGGYGAPSLKDSVAREVQNPLGNYFVSEDGKKYVTAAREWISGVLRLDSGAAVPEEEFWRYFQTYFPQAGDTPDVVQQKRAMRANVEDAINRGSAGLAGQMTSAPSQGGDVRTRIQSMSDAELEAIINGQ